MDPAQFGHLLAELGGIKGSIGRLEGKIDAVDVRIEGHEDRDDERHDEVLRRIGKVETKVEEDDKEAEVTGRHELVEAQRAASRLEAEQRISAKRRQAAKDAERNAKLASRRTLINKIILMLCTALLALGTREAIHAIGGKDAAAKTPPNASP